jgi:hypothetical protein
MELEQIAQEEGLFNSDEYRVPFPKADGKEVNRLLVRLGGSIELNRNDPEHVALIESLELGRMQALTVTASVDGKGQSFRQDAMGEEIVTHTVALRIHDVEVNA